MPVCFLYEKSYKNHGYREFLPFCTKSHIKMMDFANLPPFCMKKHIKITGYLEFSTVLYEKSYR